MMLLSPLLWLFILVETKKLFKARNEIYCSDAAIENDTPIQPDKLSVLAGFLS